jgi:hypothetical protein
MQSTNIRRQDNTSQFLGHILVIEINDFLPGGSTNGKSRSRVIPNILHLLDHIDKHRAEGNFYITPDLMKAFPEVVSLVSSRGHEIGMCCDVDIEGSFDKLESSKAELERIIGQSAYGIMLKSNPDKGREYIRKVADMDFIYGIVDFKMSLRGQTSLPISISYDNGSKIEIYPPSLYKFMGVETQFGKAGKIRLYPYWFIRKCIRNYMRNNMPATISFPLWEFDPHLPQKVLSPLQSVKSYGNLSLAEFKLTRLLMEFDFVKIPRLLEIEED